MTDNDSPHLAVRKLSATPSPDSPCDRTHIFHRRSDRSLPLAVRGEGCYLFDHSGKPYLDASGGAAVSCLGHSDQTVIEAIRSQIDHLPYTHARFFTSEPAEKLAAKLVEHAPPRLKKAAFVSSGSEAVEAAIKLSRQYHVERGHPKRHRVITRRRSYHGNTLGALAASDNPQRQAPFEPLLIPFHRIAPCYSYREQEDHETDADYGTRAAAALEEAILALDPATISAFLAETVVGSGLGAVPPVPGYFRHIGAICKRYGVLLILDEVMCGMGRTGSLFACEQEAISPDILIMAKGIGAGYQPLAALLCSADIHEAIRVGSGSFRNAHTFSSHPTACAAGLATLARLTDDGLISQVAIKGERLMNELQSRLSDHPHVGDLRGRGLLLGIELVADRESKAPFTPEKALFQVIENQALDAGLICYPMNGTLDGRRGDHILLAPPFIIEENHIIEIADKLLTTIDRAVAAIR